MTFRQRIVLLAAAAVAVAITLASVVTFVVVRHELRGGVDASLRGLRSKVNFVSRTDAAPVRPGEAGQSNGSGSVEGFQAQLPPTALGGSAGVAQATFPNGDVIRSASGTSLPTRAAVHEVASGKRHESVRDQTVRGVHWWPHDLATAARFRRRPTPSTPRRSTSAGRRTRSPPGPRPTTR